MYNKVHRLGQHACVGYEPTRGSVMIDGGELCHDDHQAFDNVAGLDKTDNHTSGNLKMRHLQSADSDLTDVRLTQKRQVGVCQRNYNYVDLFVFFMSEN